MRGKMIKHARIKYNKHTNKHFRMWQHSPGCTGAGRCVSGWSRPSASCGPLWGLALLGLVLDVGSGLPATELIECGQEGED